MAVQIGPKIGIEGEKEYRAQIQQIIQQSKSLDAAMEKTASSWTKNTSQMTKNRDVAQNLVKQIDVQKEKLQAMNQMLEQSKEKFGENATATQKWQQAVDSATASLNSMEGQLRGLGNAANFSDLSTRMADVGTKMQNIGQSLMSAGQQMTMYITVPLVAAGTASANLASQLEESSSKVDIVFGSMAESVKAFAETTLDAYGVSNVRAMEMLGTFGAMATSMGLSDKAAADMAMTLTGLSGDLAAFNNKSVEVASNSLKGIFTGETEALKSLGVTMTQVNLEEFAAKQGKAYSKMSEAEKVMTRYQYVLEKTQAAQGNFAATGEGTAGSIQKFKGAVEQLGASFGEVILPVITPIIQAITEFLKILSKLPGPIKTVIVVLGMLLAAIGPLIMIIAAFVLSLGTLLIVTPKVIAAVTSMAASFAALDLSLAPVIGILIAIVAAIAAGAAAGYYLAENWDEISAAAERLGERISSAWNNILELNDQLVQKMHGFVGSIVDAFKELPSKLITAISNAWESIKQAFDNMVQNAKKSGKDMILGFVDGIKQTISKVVNAVKEVANTVKQFLGFSCPDKGPLHEYETWMPDFMQGLAKGIRNNMGVVRSAMNGVAKTMALPLDANATMNMALAGADGGYASSYIGGMTTNVYVDHISELNDLIRIQNQAQQMQRMGVRR